MRVLIGGGTGFIGRHLQTLLKLKGHEAVVLSRKPQSGGITWNELDSNGLPENIDAVVNLSGHNLMDVTKRWNKNFEDLLRKSRIEPTMKLAQLINESKNPPSVFVTSSAVGFYAPSDTEEYTENSPGDSSSFLSMLSNDWEMSGQLAHNSKCRHVIVRIGLALGRSGGTVGNLFWPFYCGVGGPLGSGKQWFPWIHVHDVAGIIEYSIVNEHVTGVLNAVAPEFNTNAEFTKTFTQALKWPAIWGNQSVNCIPVPGFALNAIYGPIRTEAMINGQKVKPKRTLEMGYKFMYPDLKSACEQFAHAKLSNDDPPVQAR